MKQPRQQATACSSEQQMCPWLKHKNPQQQRKVTGILPPRRRTSPTPSSPPAAAVHGGGGEAAAAAAAKGYRYSPSSPSSTSPTPSSPPAATVHGGGGEAAAAAAAAATPAAWSSAAGDSGMQASGHGEHAGLNSGLRRGRPKGSGRRHPCHSRRKQSQEKFGVRTTATRSTWIFFLCLSLFVMLMRGRKWQHLKISTQSCCCLKCCFIQKQSSRRW